MENLLLKISNDLDNKNLNRTKIANKLKIDGATLSRFLNGQHQLMFHKYGELLKEIYPNEITTRRELCKEYSLSLIRPMNKKVAMYYLLSHGEFKLLKNLTNQRVTSKKCEWSVICELLYLRYSGKISGDKLLKKLNSVTKKLKTKTTEMEVLCGIVMLHVRYDQENYKEMNKLSVELIGKIGDIQDDYTKGFLKFKIQEVIVYGLLMVAEIDKVRKYCFEIINDINSDKYFPIFKITAYGVLGQSYMFTDYKKALFYLREAVKIIDNGPGDQMDVRKDMFLNTIDFLKIYWKIDLHLIKPIVKSERAFLEIQKGNFEEAIKILMEILEEKGYLDAYETFYLAIAKGNDPVLLSESLELFERSSNIFYAFLPKQYLGIKIRKCYNIMGG
ncbi:TPA: AimR family lysis-lysogeny pheromone receptor [Bacillus cereus]